MFEEIRDAIANQLNIPAENITPETLFVEDLKADSLDLVELVMDLEDRYGVEIPDEQLAEVKSVGDILALIESNKSGQYKPIACIKKGGYPPFIAGPWLLLEPF